MLRFYFWHEESLVESKHMLRFIANWSLNSFNHEKKVLAVMVNNSTYINKTKKVLAVMVNNSTFINKTINQFPLQVIEQITNTTYHVEHP